MKERPILFSGPMVRAILEGGKTMTRRLVKPVRGFEHHSILKVGMPYAADPWAVWWHGEETDRVGCLQECPHGVTGDRLWVREKFYIAAVRRDEYGIGFGADHPTGDLRNGDGGYNFKTFPCDDGSSWNWAQINQGTERWHPSIHMPRWASRLTLELTEVRVERLQDITEADARAEGVEPWEFNAEQPMTSGELGASCPYRGGFACLWDDLYDVHTWKSNPWVWVESFKVIK